MVVYMYGCKAYTDRELTIKLAKHKLLTNLINQIAVTKFASKSIDKWLPVRIQFYITYHTPTAGPC